jgi:hypothetical protein
MPVFKNGVEVALVETRDALVYTSTKRTKFYEHVAALNIKPIRYGNSSRWKPPDLDRIVQRIIELGGGM